MIEAIKKGALSQAFPGRQFSLDITKDSVADIVWLDGPAPAVDAVEAAIRDFVPAVDPLDELRKLLTPQAMGKLKALLK